MKLLTIDTFKECRQRPKYLFVFVCLMGSRLIVVLFSVYLQLWIISYEESGVLANKAESDSIYMYVVTASIFCIAIVAPAFGIISDRADARVLVPASFAMRGLCAISFQFIQDPKQWYSYTLCIITITVSVVQFISVEVLFMRNMKPHIRGTLNGLAFFFGSLGTTSFALIGGKMFDSIGPWAPFSLVGTSDLITVAFALIYIAFGLIDKYD
mmetsp:Transcript_17153/g.23130  ORF Transcript_17153/g.23130 Transcript_17153/m.23130 type:complete len:212 (+) Transcript_17153:838-1473(+)